MKANAPEKIYLQVCGDCNANDCENCKFEDLKDNVTWCNYKIFKKDIEYTRTDAFIDKAYEWVSAHILDYAFYEPYLGGVVINHDLFSDLKKAMKGE